MATSTLQRSSPAVARAFLHAVSNRDEEGLAALLAPDVWLRALLVRHVHEATTASEAVAAFREWFGAASSFEVLDTDHHTTAGRECFRYRFLLRPEWAPDRWHVIEQTGFFRVHDGRITRIDLACSGYFPVERDVGGGVGGGIGG